MELAGCKKNRANYIPLSPVSFLLRTARVYPNRTAVVYGARVLCAMCKYGGGTCQTRNPKGRCDKLLAESLVRSYANAR